ncbi:hypothetical protein EN850_02970 [Mesorhizobium sp. M8A.F.Ca.ET.207.01.1.1]|uniref:hypothetical protein n=1 Tax=Mesorhizobium sp. M8A.F.Ca.ET.207.01.1.1 TaxID=2563968 RepID=UPI00109C8339|nr:hypothetical protein [Mesorhizobium sp. M8A.F.Ca.ET.207.01.1.1]TGQ83720.1 hypothetical protein EN850_02970 [Mesorhizobium sp. M8A.F.Ca.ET.207.01.1.1]
MTDHTPKIDIEALTAQIVSLADPGDLDPALIRASVQLTVASVLETTLVSAAEDGRPAIEATILGSLRGAMRDAIPQIGFEFIPQLRSDLEELAVEILRMADVAEQLGLGPFGEKDAEAEQLTDVVREIDSTKFWRVTVCSDTASGRLLNLACDILRARCLRSLD